MNTNAKSLSISKSEAQKVLDNMMNELIEKRGTVNLLPGDWTKERLMENGLTEYQARDIISKAIKDGVAIPIRYKQQNGYISLGCRAKE